MAGPRQPTRMVAGARYYSRPTRYPGKNCGRYGVFFVGQVGAVIGHATTPFVQAGSSDLYSVIVSNAYSSVASTQALVSLVAPIPTITALPSGTFITNNNHPIFSH